MAFWLSLVAAAAVYALVALAPRLHAWIEVRHDYLTNAHRLKALEEEVDYLERVRNALQTDPEFVRRMAAASVAEDVGDAELIPVSGALIFGGEDQLQDRMPEIEPPLGAALVHRFASDRGLREGLLATAGCLVVVSFTVLNGNGGVVVRFVIQLLVAAVRLPLSRYLKPVPVAAGDDEDSDSESPNSE